MNTLIVHKMNRMRLMMILKVSKIAAKNIFKTTP